MQRLLLLLALFIVLFTQAFAATNPQQKPVLLLSLQDAILLSVRENPNVQTSKLNLITQKFNLYVQHWRLQPHYSLQGQLTETRSGSNGSDVVYSKNIIATPVISWNTPIGTSLNLTLNNQKTSHYNPSLSLQIIQPLMRGFGEAIVETALYNAQDSLSSTKLNIEGTLRNAVTGVINAYLDVLTAMRNIKINEDALSRAELSVNQTKLFIKAGRKAGNELVTVKANVASAKSQLENSRYALEQARYALLTAIGIDPNTQVDFENLNIDNLIKRYQVPPLQETKMLALKNDIQYQVDDITLHGSITRNLLVAEDNTRWQVNLTANVQTGGGSGGGQNAGLDSLFNGANQSQAVGFTFQIPIQDELSKQAVVNAKISLKQAEIGLKQEKWNKETNAINTWNAVLSAKRSLEFAADAEKLQQQTYDLSYQKYLHGLIDVLELQSAQLQLIQAQQSLLTSQITYLKALVNLDSLIGRTLKTWDVNVRYS